jgi:antitoxin component of MazEF toxin-antitoxin module
MKVEDGKLIIQRSESAPTLDQLLARVTKENLHSAIDTGEAVGNEVW